MKYLSVCSGIEAATVAWHHMGWEPVGFSEIEPFPSAVLSHHYPDVPNFGDMTNFKNWNINESDVDILVGGTPCQSFSVAGLRKGLSDERGNLALVYCEMADHFNPDFVVWENVPGVLSSGGGGDFGCFLAGLAGEDEPLVPPGGKWTNAGFVLGPKRAIAWRVLDAQYFGVAQRRRRVFVIGCPRNEADPRTILFEPEGVRRDTPPSREKRESITYDVASCIGASGRVFERTGETRGQDPVVACMAHGQGGAEVLADLCPTLNCNHEQPIVVHGTQDPCVSDVAFALGRNSGQENVFVTATQVRRLTPTECERIQGFPDTYTMIPGKKKLAEDCPDGPRYKALGNSFAVPVVRWIGGRINTVVEKPFSLFD